MWDSNDFKIIFSKLAGNFQIESSRTFTRKGGWPLETICIKYNDNNLISLQTLENAIKSSLKEIHYNWIEKRNKGPPNQIKDELRKRYNAFLLVQVANTSMWKYNYSRTSRNSIN